MHLADKILPSKKNAVFLVLSKLQSDTNKDPWYKCIYDTLRIKKKEPKRF